MLEHFLRVEQKSFDWRTGDAQIDHFITLSLLRYAFSTLPNSIQFSLLISSYLYCQLQKFREVKDQAIEQVGSFDPMLNEQNEKLVALNFERIQWWLGEGVEVSKSAAYILGRFTYGFLWFLMVSLVAWLDWIRITTVKFS